MTNYITLEEIQNTCLTQDLSVKTYIEGIFLVLYSGSEWEMVTDHWEICLLWELFFFFYSRENLFDAVNIVFDWYDQIIESLWEKKQ